ncbi:polyprenyl synthetase family protein [Epidermidibacterium keratini]|uniref:Polyprenyl synthetase family protein n=2 Tax=Epidermidibacterium keratini TaxID=1891644 RepID=A0A7L4YTA0_9ACTN|nr:polyprenyl synthetase family protein [Epidermidibacterium keratini]
MLQTASRSDDLLLDEAAAHLASAGGKRFRPLLVLLASQFGTPGGPDVDKAAVVVELTHLATLYHDDVMDEADLRRGAPSANARWDNSIAILTGDYLFAAASILVSELGPDAVRIQAETFQRLVNGQIRETVDAPAGTDPIARYLDVLAEKTGSLIATSGRFGAMFSGARAEVVEAMTEFGEAIGMAFQLSDDLIDITSDAEDLGKATGTDLREGVHTLPMLFTLADPQADPELVSLLRSGPLVDADQHARALELLRASPGMIATRGVLDEYVERARRAVDVLPEGSAKDSLDALVDFMQVRSR